MRFFIIFAVFLLLLNVSTAHPSGKGIAKAAPAILSGAGIVKDAIPEDAKDKIKEKAKDLKDKIFHL
uniref:Uncharacterized protein n=1 Tax=Panagrolaimus sp. ES5 TaxID=591445 RepID=A0AC34G2F7_9BILA